MKKLTYLLVAVLFMAVSINATTWKFDQAHTTIGFDVTHMVITTVDGKFNKFDGTVTTEGDNWETAQVTFTADVNSIDTDNEDRDEHLRSDDFFAAAEYPEMKFVGKSMEKVGDKKYKLTGDLTIRGTTKEVVLDVTHSDTIQDPWGNTRAGFSITGTINRFDFGLKWDNALETGGLVVSKEVDFDIQAQIIKQ